jgi:hypothetical protein
LGKPVKVAFKNTSLKDALAEIAKQLEIPIDLDEKQAEFSTLDPDKKITLSANRSGRSVLNSILGDLGFHYRVRDGGITLPFEDQTEAGFDTWREDVSDLADLEVKIDFEQLMEDARAVVCPATWDIAGGQGTVVFERAGDRRVFVFKQSQPVREKLDDFFANYRKLFHAALDRKRAEASMTPGKSSDKESLPPAPFMSFDEPDRPSAKIDELLESPNDFYFKETPLRKVVEVLSQKLRIPVEIDAKALAEMEIKDDVLVTKRTPRLRTRVAVDLLVEDIRMTFALRNEVLLLTSYSSYWTDGTTHYFEITDLVRASDPDVEKQNTDALAALLRSSYTLEYPWGGGDESQKIVPVAIGNSRFLAITTVLDWQRHIRDLLVHLHSLQHPPRPTAARKTPATALQRDANYSERPFPKVREALEKPIALDFKEMTLDKIAKDIERRSGIPVVVHWDKLESEEITPTQTFTVAVAETTLREALDRMAAELNIVWGIHDGAFSITTQDRYDAETEKRVYDVHDLPAFRRPDGKPTPDFAQLKLAITQSIRRQSWEDSGSSGTIYEFDSGGVQVLVVDQSYEVHERILSFLENMRKLRKWPLTSEEIEKLPPAPPPPEESETDDRPYYRVRRPVGGMGMF